HIHYSDMDKGALTPEDREKVDRLYGRQPHPRMPSEQGGNGGEAVSPNEKGSEDNEHRKEEKVKVHEFLERDVKLAADAWCELKKEFNIDSVTIEESILGFNRDFCCVILTINLAGIPQMNRELWAIDNMFTFAILIDGVHKMKFRNYHTLPTVVARIDIDPPSYFVVGECLVNLVKSYMKRTYTRNYSDSPDRIGSYFTDLYSQIMQRMRYLPDFCKRCEVGLFNEPVPVLCAICKAKNNSLDDYMEAYSIEPAVKSAPKVILYSDTIRREPSPDFHGHLKEDVDSASRTWFKLMEEKGIPSVQIERKPARWMANKPSDHCSPPLQLSLSGEERFCSVAMTIALPDLPESIRHLWGVGDASTVAVIVEGIHKRKFRTFEILPLVYARIETEKPSKFRLGECLAAEIKRKIGSSYQIQLYRPPIEAESLFSTFYEQLMDRMRMLTECCMLCGANLFTGDFIPSICDGEVCYYQAMDLEDGHISPRVAAPVLSMLLMTYHAALGSDQKQDILMPFCSADDYHGLMRDISILYENANMKCNMDNMDLHKIFKGLVCVMPCAYAVLKSSDTYWEFKKEFPYASEFAEWLVMSNSSYLQLLPDKLNVSFLQTGVQFLFSADTPAKQAEFDALVRGNWNKTRLFFYGTKMENWHSVIRSGLQMGTRFQSPIETHHTGIRLYSQLPKVYGYSTLFEKTHISKECLNKNYCFPKQAQEAVVLLAVVEVVDTPEAFEYADDKSVVVEDTKWCSIRMLVGYDYRIPTIESIDFNNIDADSKQMINDVRNYLCFENVSDCQHVQGC
ncbi:hypothetical protein PRIPAC_71550, partial [Pristionchus pacificus]